MKKYKLFSSTPYPEEYLKAALLSPVYEVIEETPLQIMNKVSSSLNNVVLVKREDRHPVHSFKLRGAYTMISGLSVDERACGVITASAGNHAQGVAFSANKLGISSLIVMPTTTSNIKIDAVRSFGGQTLLSGANFDESKDVAINLAKERSLTFVPPFDHPAVIAGQGTLAIELLHQDANLDRIFVPVGGGGLVAGIAVLIKYLMPHIKIIAVEPEDSACLCAALHAGVPVCLEKVGLFAEGVAVRCIGSEPFRLCQEYLDDIITVDSDSICSAVKDLFEDVRAVAEPSGALALAGLKKYVQQHSIHGERLAHILSGANFNFHSLRYISERCEFGSQREVLMVVTIPEKKGSFLDFCKLLGGCFVTEFNYRYTDAEDVRVFVSVRLVDGFSERDAMLNTIIAGGYHVVDLSDDEIAKLHIRYMVGGRLTCSFRERFVSFEFPEFPGALLQFLQTLGTRWNISLFHYRSHGSDYARVLAGFDLSHQDIEFNIYLSRLGYDWHDVTHSAVFNSFFRK